MAPQSLFHTRPIAQFLLGVRLLLIPFLSLFCASPALAGKVTVPVAPSNLSAIASSSTQINLNWLDMSSNETGFIIQRATTSAGPWSQIATVGAGITSYAN